MLGIISVLFFVFYMILMMISLIGIPFLVLHIVLMIRGATSRSEAAYGKVQESLMDGESIVAIGIEKRPFSLFSRRSVIAITDSRVLFVNRHILGGFGMIDIQWKDLIDAELSQNIFPAAFGSTIFVSHSLKKKPIKINVPCAVANEIYKYAQKQEQAWEEKRRIRAIEEARANSGGTYITSASSQPSEQANNKSIIDEIKEAKVLLQEGAISDSEFDELKSRILMNSSSP